MKAAAFIAIILSVVVSVVASSGAGAQLFQFVQLLPGRDLTGHFVLYGFLGFTVAGWLGRTPKTARDTGWTAALMALLIIAEEGRRRCSRRERFRCPICWPHWPGCCWGFSLPGSFPGRPRTNADCTTPRPSCTENLCTNQIEERLSDVSAPDPSVSLNLSAISEGGSSN